jgi:hypothetical protein
MTDPIYTVTKVSSDGVQVEYEDGSWAVLPVTAEMEAADVDDLALQYAPKDLTPPAFLSVGTQRSAVKKPDQVPIEEESDPE